MRSRKRGEALHHPVLIISTLEDTLCDLSSSLWEMDGWPELVSCWTGQECLGRTAPVHRLIKLTLVSREIPTTNPSQTGSVPCL